LYDEPKKNSEIKVTQAINNSFTRKDILLGVEKVSNAGTKLTRYIKFIKGHVKRSLNTRR
jgi:hypothetical protein